jgi:putative endonuclease
MRTSAQQAGDAAEARVAAALESVGWTILGRQVHVGRAELDLIAIDPHPPPSLVVVEVRWRRRRDFGLAEETVGRTKRERLRRAAWQWLATTTQPPRLPLRFDLIVVEPGTDGEIVIRHHRAAF